MAPPPSESPQFRSVRGLPSVTGMSRTVGQKLVTNRTWKSLTGAIVAAGTDPRVS